LIDYETGINLVPEIHKRVGGLKSIPMKNNGYLPSVHAAPRRPIIK